MDISSLLLFWIRSNHLFKPLHLQYHNAKEKMTTIIKTYIKTITTPPTTTTPWTIVSILLYRLCVQVHVQVSAAEVAETLIKDHNCSDVTWSLAGITHFADIIIFTNSRRRKMLAILMYIYVETYIYIYIYIYVYVFIVNWMFMCWKQLPKWTPTYYMYISILCYMVTKCHNVFTWNRHWLDWMNLNYTY